MKKLKFWNGADNQCGISDALDGSEDHFLYEDDDEQEDEDIDEREDSDDSDMGFAGFWKVSLLFTITLPRLFNLYIFFFKSYFEF